MVAAARRLGDDAPPDNTQGAQTDDAKAQFKKASSEKLSDIFAGLNEALQELADSGQPLFITPLGSPDSEGATPVRWECNGIPTFDIKEALEAMRMPLYSVEFQAGGPQAESRSTDQKEQAKPGTTVVHAERVVVDDRKMIRILKFENVCAKPMLPISYLNSFPKYYGLHSGIAIMEWVGTAAIQHNIFNGYVMSIKDFGKRIKTMKEAAARLSKINKTAKLEKEHSGKFTVSI